MEAEKNVERIESIASTYYVPKHEPIWKFCFLSMVTFGIYTLMWYYRQFRRMKEKYSFDLSPFWRSFFAPLWVFGLFKSVRLEAKDKGLESSINPHMITALYGVLTIAHKLPDPYWLISMLSFCPVIPVVRAANEVNRMERPTDIRNGFSWIEWFLAIAGSLLMVLAILGTLFPE